MNTLVSKLKFVFKFLTHLFPTRLPIGMVEFTSWSQDIITTYGLPDNDSFRFSLAAMIINLKATTAYKPKFYFFLSCRSAMAKQVAGEVFRQIKEAQQAAAKAAAQTQTEATVTPIGAAVSDAARQ